MKSLLIMSNLVVKKLSDLTLNGYQQYRNTYILKRKWAPYLSKKNYKMRKFRARDYIYDLVEDTDKTHAKSSPLVKLILTEDVESIGSKGDVVDVKEKLAHSQLLPSQQAIHASPENLAKLEDDKAKGLIQTREKHSSPWAPKTIKELSQMFLSVVMNLEEKWELEPWHLRVAFRKAGYWVPEDAITMPNHSITGPDLNKEGKEFFIQVTINNREKVNIRCRIHHWSTDISKRLPPIPDHWKFPAEPMFDEDLEILNSLPIPKGIKTSSVRN